MMRLSTALSRTRLQRRRYAVAVLTTGLLVLSVAVWTSAPVEPLGPAVLVLLALLVIGGLYYRASVAQHLATAQALRDTEIRYRTLVEELPDAVVLVDPESLAVLDFNDAAARNLGFSREEFGRLRVGDLVADESTEDLRRRVETIREQRRDDFETRIATRDGDLRAVLVTAKLLQIGGRALLFNLIRDITEVKRVHERLRASEERLNHALQGASDGLFDWDLANDRIYFSPRWKGMLGYADDELENSIETFERLVDPVDGKRVWSMLHDYLAGRRDEFGIEIQMRHKAGHWVDILGRGKALRDTHGEPVRMVGTHVDITAQKSAERKLAASEARYRNLVEVAPYSVQEIDTEANIRYANPASAAILGYTQEQLVSMNVAELLPPEDRAAFRRMLHEMVVRQPKPQPVENVNLTGDGRRIHVRVSWNYLRDTTGQVAGFVSIADDVTEARRAAAAIEHLAFHDHLTGLPNRLLLKEKLGEALVAQDRSRRAFALHILDLDHFKEINDSLGHPFGDQLLDAVAARIREVVRSGDFLARLGGDEFALVQMELGDIADASSLALKMLEAVSRPFRLDANLVYTNASIGILVNEDPTATVDELMSRADVALYKAKDGGRGSYAFFEDSMTLQLQQEMALTRQLLQALELGELVLKYQPQFALADGRLLGAEALLRWHHPERGELTPGEFLEVAEKRGLIRAIGDWVLAEVARQAADWASRGLCFGRLAVNVSAAQFNDGAFAEGFLNIVQETGVDPCLLELEYTETVLMKASDSTRAAILELSALGVSFAIDDFGTGFSSLMYLKQFHTDKLKIDREFVRDLPNDQGDAEIVKATIALAHALGLTTVAEGVEEEAHAEFLKRQGCDQVQGYLYARPMTAEALEQRLGSETGSCTGKAHGCGKGTPGAAPRV